MRILSIETSCDETAVSVVEATGGLTSPHFEVLGNSLFSQVELHKEYGGVFPTLAKREHAKNLSPLLLKTLTDANLNAQSDTNYPEKTWSEIETILSKEIGLYDAMRQALEHVIPPAIDMISVTSGPGLEPALWVGISFALALSKLWNIPVIPANHMEGHIASILMQNTDTRPVTFPAVALLISGGHTELVMISDWGKYNIIGETRDDAVGEAFDKVARLLGLPYPGGPEISRLAELARETNIPLKAKLPRPMLHSGNMDFSFSGLKTAVLYYIRDHIGDAAKLTDTDKADLAREFEDAVVDVLVSKTHEALELTGSQTLIIAGGVIANKKIRQAFKTFEQEYIGLVVKIPTHTLATDNALMIACAGYITATLHPELLLVSNPHIIAKGNLKLGDSTS